jgi:hypothetical protein
VVEVGNDRRVLTLAVMNITADFGRVARGVRYWQSRIASLVATAALELAEPEWLFAKPVFRDRYA